MESCTGDFLPNGAYIPQDSDLLEQPMKFELRRMDWMVMQNSMIMLLFFFTISF